MPVARQSLTVPVRRAVAGALTAAAGALLCSCTVGPDFKQPEVQTPDGWAGTAPDPGSPPEASRPVAGAPDIARWWGEFQDPTLTSLIDRAFEANLDIALAEARIRQARASQMIAGSTQLPTLNLNAAAVRSRNSSGTGNLYRAGFDASWEIDVFGGTRRTVEAADADLVTAVEDRRAVLVSLAAEVATNYFDVRANQQLLITSRRNLELQQKSAALTRERARGGFVSGLDVATADAQVASTSSLIPLLESSLRQSIYALGVLLGQEPASLLTELSSEGVIPIAPPEIPVGLPSELLRRRPDIRAAESALHAATARVGVATADLFPRFSLVGSLGIQGPRIGSVSSADNRYWSIGPSMSWPLFTGGQIEGNIEIQKALTDQSAIAYRKAVLVALQEVENALVSFTKEQQRHASLVDAVQADKKSLDLASTLYKAGRTDFLNVLTVQRSLLASEDALVQSDRQIATYLVALYKALGGGWEEETEPAHPPEPESAEVKENAAAPEATPLPLSSPTP